MIIKNSDYNLNYISNSYAGKKPDKADISVQGGANTCSTFSGELNKISNTSKVDTIELSQHPVNNQTTLPAVRDKIIAELNEDKDAAYLEQLKEQIKSNQYTANPLEMAKIMFLNNY